MRQKISRHPPCAWHRLDPAGCLLRELPRLCMNCDTRLPVERMCGSCQQIIRRFCDERHVVFFPSLCIHDILARYMEGRNGAYEQMLQATATAIDGALPENPLPETDAEFLCSTDTQDEA